MQAPAAELTSLLAWFRQATDADHGARLAFPQTLPKAQRALVRTIVTSVGLGSLQCISEGIGEERYIYIVRCGAEPSQVCMWVLL